MFIGLSDLRVASWDGDKWKDSGANGLTGSVASGSLGSASLISLFGLITLASVGSFIPLPIEIIEFSGRCNDEKIMLQWTTASETNNDFFTVESSFNGSDWQPKQKTKGAGNSSTPKSCLITDSRKYEGISYYRLKQTDFDGKFKYSEIISLENCSEAAPRKHLTVFPNPSKGCFQLLYTDTLNEFQSIEIYNSQGETIFKSQGCQSTIDLSSKPPGVYFLICSFRTLRFIEKIIKEF